MFLKDASESNHFCSETMKRVHAFCAHEVAEGAGSKNPCFKCSLPPSPNCVCRVCLNAMTIIPSNEMNNAVFEVTGKNNVLCMGMVYASENYAKKESGKSQPGQAIRDRRRCLKLEEMFDAVVYTVDDKHSNDRFDLEKGRHYFGKFDVHDFTSELLDTIHIEGKFSFVLFDSFFTPSGWIETRWGHGLFKKSIPGFYLMFQSASLLNEFLKNICLHQIYAPI